MIFGKRVYFRPLEHSDQADVIALNNDPVVRGNVVGWSWPSSVFAQTKWFEGSNSTATHRWAVCNGADQMIGLTGLWDVDWHSRHALTALKLGGPHLARGQGLGVDAIMTAMAFAFYDVGLNRLHGSIIVGNEASKRAYCGRCGWSVEGLLRQHVWRHGKFVDVETVAVLKEDFDRLPDAGDYVALIREGRSENSV